MRKIRIIILTILIALIVAVFAYEKLDKHPYSDQVLSDEQIAAIKSGRTQRDDWQPELRFDGQKLIYDEASQSYFYSLVDGSDSASNPDVYVDKAGENVSIAFGSAITSETISSNSKIEVCIYSNEYYCEKNLVCSTLPLMCIDSEEEIGDLDVRTEISLFDNSKESRQRNISSVAYVRIRGNHTRNFPKKSYKISLKSEISKGKLRNRDLPLLGMREDDDWVLTACYNDQEKVRNLFSENLWMNSCGTDNAYHVQTGLECKFIELFMNGQYWGLYTLGYKPDSKSIGNGVSSEELFYKRDSLLNGFTNDSDVSPIYEYHLSLEENANDNEYLKSVIDIDNAIDFNLYITLIQGYDTVSKNYYVLLRDDDKRAIYIPWDMDVSWGVRWSAITRNNTVYYTISPDDNMFFYENALYQLLHNNDEETWDLLFNKYGKLRKGGWSDVVVEKMLEDYESQLFASGAFLRERDRWPEADLIEENSLNTFKQFVLDRFNEMDLLIEKLKSERTNNSLINQSLLNKNLDCSTIVVEIADGSVLENDDYKELMEYMGIDVTKISGDTRFVITSLGGKDAEYISNFDDDVNYAETKHGVLNLITKDSESESGNSDNEYTVVLDDKELYTNSSITGEPFVVVSLFNDIVTRMKMGDGYEVSVDMDSIQDLLGDNPDPNLILRLLDNMSGYAMVQITSTDSDLYDKEGLLDQFEIDYGPYTSLEEAKDSSDKLAFLLDCDRRTGCCITDPFTNGTVCDTAMGQYAYYASDTDYGIYIDGTELQSGSVDSLEEHNLIISVFTRGFSQLISKYEF